MTDRRAAQSHRRGPRGPRRRQSLPPSSRRPRPSSRSPCESTLGELRADRRASSPGQIVARIATGAGSPLRAQSRRAGPDIIERGGSRPAAHGASPITTGARSKPWLSDMATRDQEGILRHPSSDGQRDGIASAPNRPRTRGYFDGTEHNAVTASSDGGAEDPDRRPVASLPEDRGPPISQLHRRRRRAAPLPTGPGPITWRGTARSTRSIRPHGSATELRLHPHRRRPTASRKGGAGVEESDSITLNTRGTSKHDPPTDTH